MGRYKEERLADSILPSSVLKLADYERLKFNKTFAHPKNEKTKECISRLVFITFSLNKHETK